MQDGDLASKFTWVYGPMGPLTAPCTAEGHNDELTRSSQ